MDEFASELENTPAVKRGKYVAFHVDDQLKAVQSKAIGSFTRHC